MSPAASHPAAPSSPLSQRILGRLRELARRPAAVPQGVDPGARRPHVVVIGGGFAGVAAARALRGAHASVTLVDRAVQKTFQPLLYQVATAGLNPGDVSLFLRGLRSAQENLNFRQGELTAINTAERRLEFADGGIATYDYLIVTAGVSTNYLDTPGAEEFSLPMYSSAQAILIRDTLFSRLERAVRTGTNRLDVVIVGGGATGVELAGALADLRNNDLGVIYPEINKADFTITMIQRGPEVLKPFHANLREYAAEALRRRQVTLRFGAGVARVDEGKVVLTDGEELSADLILWAAGVSADDSVAAWSLPQGRGGRVVINDRMQVADTERVFAAGDIAGYATDPLPQLAQPAIQGGRHAAHGVLHAMYPQTHPDPGVFAYFDKGTMATIGRRAAITQLPNGLRLTGTPAWLAWMVVHVATLFGSRTRFATLINLLSLYGGLKGRRQPNPISGELRLPPANTEPGAGSKKIEGTGSMWAR